MARLLYVTHIDWDHAWQRPQALARALAATHAVTVAAPVARRRDQLVRNPRDGLRVSALWRVPGSLQSARVYAVNNALARLQLSRMIHSLAPRWIVVSAPECAAWIAPGIDIPIVYDCMDDALAFTQPPAVRDARSRDEQALLARARLVVCTAAELARRAIARGALPARVAVIANGYDPAAFALQAARALPASGPLRVGYFGTIADWLDLATLEGIVEANPDVAIRLIGPLETRWRPRNPRLQVELPLANDRLAAAVDDCDVMIVPFVANDLTRGIDPVKLYEYIALGRPILCLHYPGLERFAPFVTFYRDAAELRALVAQRAVLPAAPIAARERFLATASWRVRADAFAALLAGTAGEPSQP